MHERGVGRRRRSSVQTPLDSRRKASSEPSKDATEQEKSELARPDSNRGHHDFQSSRCRPFSSAPEPTSGPLSRSRRAPFRSRIPFTQAKPRRPEIWRGPARGALVVPSPARYPRLPADTRGFGTEERVSVPNPGASSQGPRDARIRVLLSSWSVHRQTSSFMSRMSYTKLSGDIRKDEQERARAAGVGRTSGEMFDRIREALVHMGVLREANN